MMDRLVLPALLVVGLAGCESTNLDPRWHYDYQDYLSKGHYRAFAVTGGTSQGLATAYGQSWNYGSVEEAMERALEGCKEGEQSYIEIWQCHLHSIGDIRVVAMSDEQMAKAIALYKSNRYATNDDLVDEAPKVMMSGAEIQKLYASGAKLNGTYEGRTKFTIEHFSDGTATINWKDDSESGSDKGFWAVMGDKSCKKWSSLFDGAQRCWTIYNVGNDTFASYEGDKLVATWSVAK